MANHKSAIKRHLQSEKRRARNRSLRSALHTQLKKARVEIASNKASINGGELKLATIKLAKAASKGLIHRKTAARRISRLMRAVKTAA